MTRRKERKIMKQLRLWSVEVFTFGSVPLKTYLPDGDIDLTVLSHQNVEEDLARDVCAVLEGEEQDSDFQITDVHYIRAQVKIVKCNINNVAVDISFNQMAGLCTLCFLEQVDQLIGKDHLFKRSIILVKAWCYYESRILGAHNGLISTYALETLVLYIINIFHSSLCGPLAVLYRFLDYYSTFDWDNYGISINGPVAVSSLPEIVVGTPEHAGDELLLGQEFLQRCKEIYSVPTRAMGTNVCHFPIKYLNIVDPLRDNNNLGRSVGKGNFHRIRSALSYGAQNLREILMLPGESMGAKLENFFMTTLERNGKGQRPDVRVPVPAFGTGRSEASDLNGDYDGYYNSLVYGQWYHGYTLPGPAQPSSPSSSCQTQNRSAWDTLRRFVGFKRNQIYQRGANVFVPRLPFCHSHTSQLPAATFSFDEVGKSRGTGTYIPDTRHGTYGDMYAWVRALKLEFSNDSSSLEPSEESDQIEDSQENDHGGNTGNLSLPVEQYPILGGVYDGNLELSVEQFPVVAGGNDGSLNLSVEEFPVLAGTNDGNLNLSVEEFPVLAWAKDGNLDLSVEQFPVLTGANDGSLDLVVEQFPVLARGKEDSSSEIHQFGQSTMNSSHPVGSMKSGTPSPSGQSSPARKQADSALPSTLDSGSDEEGFLIQTYQLNSSSRFAVSLLCLIFLLPLLSSFAEATVPPSERFQYVNEGEFGPYIVEYDASYRVLDPFNAPFQLCFYNTTPDAFTLALRMGTRRSESLMRWVWEANRGKPVRENATLTLGADGNLVLADADGTIAWQTNTTNKGVVGFKVLSNGNMVLHDAKGNFVWQSFDYPTDTLLVGQSLRVGGPAKLVSRASETNNVDGAYSLVVEPKRVAMYYKSSNSRKPLVYFTSSVWFSSGQGNLEKVTFNCTPDTDEAFAYDLTLDLTVARSQPSGSLILARPKYNSTLSYLRLGIDGNLKLFTYSDKVDWGAWEETFTLFDRDSSWATECQLPERCGKFGLCEDNQCVACPSPSGLLGWSKNCEAKKITSCGVNDFYYYKLEGVDHFMSKYNKGDGPMKEGECGNKCSKDCKCLGYFYNTATSRCWIAYDLQTLDKVSNSTHLGYIKVPK